MKDIQRVMEKARAGAVLVVEMAVGILMGQTW